MSSTPPETKIETVEASSQQIMSNATGPSIDTSVATLSAQWEYDNNQTHCVECSSEFNLINRKHHCRLCGKIFCNDCSKQRALIPPSSIVLVPKGGKKVSAAEHEQMSSGISFNPDDDPDRMLTYMDTGNSTSESNSTMVYGKGLEERTKLAREPLRVCRQCYVQLQAVQEELRNSNSNAMRFNSIDPTDAKRLFNSPLAFTLGHEIRKAAYTLNNLLPLPRRMGAFVPDTSNNEFGGSFPGLTTGTDTTQQCKETCTTLGSNVSNLDGVRIPARLLEQAKGIAVLTVVKSGFGLAGFEFGTGLVVARLGNNWSAPAAIGTAGISWGALIGAQVSDHVFLLMTDSAVELMFSNDGSINLGADVGVALGPLGRAVEGNVGASTSAFAPIYTYSLSKGLYAGVSLDGKVIVTRHNVNEKFYGRKVSGTDLLSGIIPTPPAAQPLYDALTRCHVYATRSLDDENCNIDSICNPGVTVPRSLGQPRTHEVSFEYGEPPERYNIDNINFTQPLASQQPTTSPIVPRDVSSSNMQFSGTSASSTMDSGLGGAGSESTQATFGGVGSGMNSKPPESEHPPAPNDQHSYAAQPTIVKLPPKNLSTPKDRPPPPTEAPPPPPTEASDTAEVKAV